MPCLVSLPSASRHLPDLSPSIASIFARPSRMIFIASPNSGESAGSIPPSTRIKALSHSTSPSCMTSISSRKGPRLDSGASAPRISASCRACAVTLCRCFNVCPPIVCRAVSKLSYPWAWDARFPSDSIRAANAGIILSAAASASAWLMPWPFNCSINRGRALLETNLFQDSVSRLSSAVASSQISWASSPCIPAATAFFCCSVRPFSRARTLLSALAVALPETLAPISCICIVSIASMISGFSAIYF